MLNRQESPDAIKGLCIVLMVFGHIAYIGSWERSLSSINAFIYTFHMPLFIVISGYFFKIKQNLREQLLGVVLRIGVPYVVFISLYMLGLVFVASVGVPTSNHPPSGIGEFVVGIFLRPFGAYWFLHSLMLTQFAFILAGFLVKRFVSEEGRFFLVFLLSVVMLSVLVKIGILELRFVVYFIIGMLVSRFSRNGFFAPLLPVLAMSGFLLAIDVFCGHGTFLRFYFVQVVWCLLLTSLFWTFFQNYKCWLTHLMAWLGRNTLVILLMHALFIVSMKPLNKVFIFIDPTGFFQSIFVTVLVVSLCLFAAKLFDYFGLSRFLFFSDRIYNKWPG